MGGGALGAAEHPARAIPSARSALSAVLFPSRHGSQIGAVGRTCRAAAATGTRAPMRHRSRWG